MQFSTLFFSIVSFSATIIASPVHVLERRGGGVCKWPDNFQPVSYNSTHVHESIMDDAYLVSNTMEFKRECAGGKVKRSCLTLNSPAAYISNFKLAVGGQTMLVSIGFWFKHLVQDHARRRLYSTQTITNGGLSLQVSKASASTFVALSSCGSNAITMVQGASTWLKDAATGLMFESVEFTSKENIPQILYRTLFPNSNSMEWDLEMPLKVAARKLSNGQFVIYHYGG